jgi:hypothetical protein
LFLAVQRDNRQTLGRVQQRQFHTPAIAIAERFLTMDSLPLVFISAALVA